MTTRAGFAGILTGLLSILIIYPLFIAQPDTFLQIRSADSPGYIWIALVTIAILFNLGWIFGWPLEPLHPSLAPDGTGWTVRRARRSDHLLFFGRSRSWNSQVDQST